MPGHLHLVIGPVGAGKSTFARVLCAEHDAISIDLDTWMVALFGADERPETGRIEWYVERRDRALGVIEKLRDDMLLRGANAVLEIGLLSRADRATYYDRVEAAGFPLTVYVLDAPREDRWVRVEKRNALPGVQVVPEPFFVMASNMWEPPEEDERSRVDMRSCEDVTVPGGPPTWTWDR